jgi:hypothetical protein
VDTEVIDLNASRRRKARPAAPKLLPVILRPEPCEIVRAAMIGLKLIGPQGCADLAHYLSTRVAPVEELAA